MADRRVMRTYYRTGGLTFMIHDDLREAVQFDFDGFNAGSHAGVQMYFEATDEEPSRRVRADEWQPIWERLREERLTELHEETKKIAARRRVRFTRPGAKELMCSVRDDEFEETVEMMAAFGWTTRMKPRKVKSNGNR